MRLLVGLSQVLLVVYQDFTSRWADLGLEALAAARQGL